MATEILIGSTFKARFISSGSSPSAIVHTIYDGNENIVNSGTGTNSGNGHYYRDTLVNTPGYYVSEWLATIAGNQYKKRTRIKAVREEAD